MLPSHVKERDWDGHGLCKAPRDHIQLAMDVVHESSAGPPPSPLDLKDRAVVQVQSHGAAGPEGVGADPGGGVAPNRGGIVENSLLDCSHHIPLADVKPRRERRVAEGTEERGRFCPVQEQGASAVNYGLDGAAGVTISESMVRQCVTATPIFLVVNGEGHRSDLMAALQELGKWDFMVSREEFNISESKRLCPACGGAMGSIFSNAKQKIEGNEGKLTNGTDTTIGRVTGDPEEIVGNGDGHGKLFGRGWISPLVGFYLGREGGMIVGAAGFVERIGTASQFDGLANGAKGCLDTTSFDLFSTSSETFPNSSGKNLKQGNFFCWIHILQVRIETGGKKVAPVPPVTLARCESRCHDPSVDIGVDSSESTRPMVAAGSWHSSQEAFCGRGKRS